MAVFTVLGLGVTGPIFTPCSAEGDTFDNTSPGTVVLFRNQNASPRTVTVIGPNPCSFTVTDASHNRIVEIPGDPGPESYIRVTIDPSRHNALNGIVSLTYSSVAGLSAAVLSMVQ